MLTSYLLYKRFLPTLWINEDGVVLDLLCESPLLLIPSSHMSIITQHSLLSPLISLCHCPCSWGVLSSNPPEDKLISNYQSLVTNPWHLLRTEEEELSYLLPPCWVVNRDRRWHMILLTWPSRYHQWLYDYCCCCSCHGKDSNACFNCITSHNILIIVGSTWALSTGTDRDLVQWWASRCNKYCDN